MELVNIDILEEELNDKTRIMEELESLQRSSKDESARLSEELLNANKEHKETNKLNVNNIQDHRTEIKTLKS